MVNTSPSSSSEVCLVFSGFERCLDRWSAAGDALLVAILAGWIGGICECPASLMPWEGEVL